MTTYNTGNPIGSTDARDRLDNSENMDILENSTTLNEHPDRLGVMRKTRKGMEDEHDAQIAAHEAEFIDRILKMAFTTVGTFTSGATLTDARQTLLWEVSEGGDGHYYSWSGSFPKAVAAGSSPSPISSGSWVDRTDDTLRDEIRETVFQNMKRLYAEAGFNLVDGSFQLGGSLSGWSDVLWDWMTGKGYQWHLDEAKVVAAGSSPTNIGTDWINKSRITFRSEISGIDGAGMVGYDEDNEYGVGTVGGELNSIASISPPVLVQKKMCEPFLGYDNGTTDTQIFPNSQSTSQGLAYANVSGVEKIYLSQSTAGSSNLADERKRIVEFTLAEDGSVVNNTAFSAELSIGHQSLSALVQGSTVKLYSAMTTAVGHEGTDAGKGYSVTTWAGNATTQADVVNYQLWGYAGSGHRFAGYYGATVAVSTDGRYVILVGSDISSGGEIEDTINIAFVYDRMTVEAAADPLTVNPLYCVQLTPPNSARNQYNQGAACDGKYIYLIRGYYSPLLQHTIQKFDFMGNLIQEIEFDDARSVYGVEGILNNVTLGTPISFEPEGIALRQTESGTDILTLTMDNWGAGTQIVSYAGKNWASIQPSNTGNSPDNELYWVRTTKAATDGAWNEATTYGNGTNASRRSKMVYAIRAPRGDAGEEGIAAGITAKQSGASINSRSNAVDFSWRYGDVLQFASYSENTETFYNGIQYGGQQFWRVFDQRPGSDNTKYVYLGAQFSGGREIMEIRARDSGLINGAGINLYGIGDSGSPGKAIFYARNSATATTWETHLQTDGVIRPGAPDVQDLGTQSSFKFRRLYAISTILGPAGASAQQTAGNGSPEGIITAPVGSIYWRNDGAAGTYLYRKNTGSGNTGWVAIL